MVTVEFLGPIDKDPTQYDAQDLTQLKQMLQKDSTIEPWLKNCAVALNNELISDLEIKLNDGDKISILPPVCGG